MGKAVIEAARAAAESVVSDLVQVKDIVRHFAPQVSVGDRIASRLGSPVETRTVRAVDGVSLSIARGEVLGLVGESGCGKSTLGRMIAGILPPTAGSAVIDGVAVMSSGRRPRKTTTRVQMVFQDPFASLDPRMKIGDAIAEGPRSHGLVNASQAPAYVAQWLQAVGLDAQFASRYAHQFSGGQRQRIAVARALAMQPDVLVCDEPVASLDISIQAQIINLFLKLRRDLGLTMLFISHDLGVVRHVSDRIAIMYLGRIVETGPTGQVYTQPRHPYTRGLLDSIPRLVLDAGVEVNFKPIQGELPSPLAPPPGCHFHQRCPRVQDRCRHEAPLLAETEGLDILEGPDRLDGPAEHHRAASRRRAACHYPIVAVDATTR